MYEISTSAKNQNAVHKVDGKFYSNKKTNWKEWASTFESLLIEWSDIFVDIFLDICCKKVLGSRSNILITFDEIERSTYKKGSYFLASAWQRRCFGPYQTSLV